MAALLFVSGKQINKTPVPDPDPDPEMSVYAIVYLLDIVSSSNIHNDLLDIGQRSRDVERAR